MKKLIKFIFVLLIIAYCFYSFNDSFIILIDYLPENKEETLVYYFKSFLVHLGLYLLYLLITFIMFIVVNTILKFKE